MFENARTTLTIWYLIIIMTVSLTFSLALYSMMSREVDRFEQMQRTRIQRRFGQAPLLEPDQELTDEIRKRIIIILGIINGGIFVFAGGFGYLLAGRTLKPIQDMVEEQHRFVSDASHELRTPLTSLKTAFEVYLREPSPSEKTTRQLVTESIEEVDAMQRLTDSLLQLAQADQSEESMLLTEPVNIHSALHETRKHLLPLAKKKSIKITIKNGKTTTHVQSQKETLVKLFTLFIDNAIKYSPPKTTVTIQVRPKKKYVYIDIKDEGIGINPEDADAIFRRFYRANPARSHSAENGYGLGLSIAKKIITTHHGTITLQQNPNQKGTTFTIKLPRQTSSA